MAGEKLFVDFSGTTIPIVDRRTGDISKAEVFVAVMGVSNYTFVMALNSQKIEDWILGHVKAFEFLGGCPEIVVPDNLKSGVTKPCRYEPQIQSTYAEMASHYGMAIIPCSWLLKSASFWRLDAQKHWGP
ncbi:MAG: transposase [Gammaproteobacteria bacterium]|nr:transposase [Gammaproteobacteria bacterium]